jgi:hypothetical protein
MLQARHEENHYANVRILTISELIVSENIVEKE